jgi:hypothetical protein
LNEVDRVTKSVRITCLALAAVVVVACSSEAAAPVITKIEQTKTDAVSTISEWIAVAAEGREARKAKPAATPALRFDQPPVAANDPGALAQQLVMIDAALHDPSIPAEQLSWFGQLQQLAYSRIVDYPEWKTPVLAALPERARVALTGSLEAGKQLRSMGGPIPKVLPDWKIVAPAPADELIKDYKAAEAEFGVPWYYLAAINLVETRMGRIRGLSSAGAQGPMQFMPGTWAMYGKGDVNNNRDAIMGAARYLKAAGAPDDMPRALYAYNHAIAYVNALIAYAEVMKADAAAYRGYHGWQVYYPTQDGPMLLPVGWAKD